MDAILFIGLALGTTIYLLFSKNEDAGDATVELEDVTREAKLNDSYYEDPNAFSLIINALGFPKGGGA